MSQAKRKQSKPKLKASLNVKIGRGIANICFERAARVINCKVKANNLWLCRLRGEKELWGNFTNAAQVNKASNDWEGDAKDRGWNLFPASCLARLVCIAAQRREKINPTQWKPISERGITDVAAVWKFRIRRMVCRRYGGALRYTRLLFLRCTSVLRDLGAALRWIGFWLQTASRQLLAGMFQALFMSAGIHNCTGLKTEGRGPCVSFQQSPTQGKGHQR